MHPRWLRLLVAQNTPGLLGRSHPNALGNARRGAGRALPDRRLARLGATSDFTTGLLCDRLDVRSRANACRGIRQHRCKPHRRPVYLGGAP